MIEGSKARVEIKHEMFSHLKNSPVVITKEIEFEAAHHLNNYLGKCAYSHGHTYKLQISIKGVPDYRGLVMDFSDLKKLIKDIVDDLDHNYLNEYFRFNPTCEEMSKWLWGRLDNSLPTNVSLYEIKLWETPTSFATVNKNILFGGTV